jgi:hypothetical protein
VAAARRPASQVRYTESQRSKNDPAFAKVMMALQSYVVLFIAAVSF